MYTVSEIKAQLKLDGELKLFFVEGLRDLAFWRKLVPQTKRNNVQVIKISLVQGIDIDLGGEKGRLIKLSNMLNDLELQDRVKFFADSDNDKIIAKTHKPTVLLTDYRDLESYCFSKECIQELIETGLAIEGRNIKTLMGQIESFCKPLGILRAISEKSNYHLSFSKTFAKNGRRKFIKKNEFCLDLDKLVTTLLQNTNLGLNLKDDLIKELTSSLTLHSKSDVRHFIQGKDWLFYLSELLSLDSDSIEKMLFLALDYSSLFEHEKITESVNYLTSEQLAA